MFRDLKKATKYWVGNHNPFDTFLMTAALIPVDICEEFIIGAVLDTCHKYKDNLPVEYKDEAFRLLTEEHEHRIKHQAIRTRLDELGYPVQQCVNSLNTYFGKIKTKSLEEKLAYAVVMEYKIKIGSKAILDDTYLLSNPKNFDFIEFLREHATEEIEHYMVSLNLYKKLGFSKRVLFKVLRSYSTHSFKEYHVSIRNILKKENLTINNRFYFYLHYLKRMWIGSNPVLLKTALGIFGLFSDC